MAGPLVCPLGCPCSLPWACTCRAPAEHMHMPSHMWCHSKENQHFCYAAGTPIVTRASFRKAPKMYFCHLWHLWHPWAPKHAHVYIYTWLGRWAPRKSVRKRKHISPFSEKFGEPNTFEGVPSIAKVLVFLSMAPHVAWHVHVLCWCPACAHAHVFESKSCVVNNTLL